MFTVLLRALSTWSLGISFALVVLSGPLAAQNPMGGTGRDTLRLGTVLEEVRSANHTIRATAQRTRAASYRIGPAGALPDPMVGLGLMNRPLDLGADQMMTMDMIQVTQRFPWPGSLHFAQEQMRHLAESAEFEEAEVRLGVVARTTEVYHRIGFLDRAVDTMNETRGLLEDFLEVTTAMYEVGTAVQQDVLQAQVAIQRLSADITMLEETRVASVARLNALMGRNEEVPVEAVELPPPSMSLDETEPLVTRAESARPAIESARERIRAAEAAVAAARRRTYPQFSLSIGYGERPNFSDLATVMLGISVPLWAGSKQGQVRMEMEATLAEAEASLSDLYSETFAEISEQRARAARSAELWTLYTGTVIPQARAAVDASLSAYRSGRVDYTTVLQNLMTANQYEVESHRLAADYHGAIAQIEALLGESIGGRR